MAAAIFCLCYYIREMFPSFAGKSREDAIDNVLINVNFNFQLGIFQECIYDILLFKIKRCPLSIVMELVKWLCRSTRTHAPGVILFTFSVEPSLVTILILNFDHTPE